ncbi:hypothetical protein JCM9279_000355 [Rhodotorula babjevae]
MSAAQQSQHAAWDDSLKDKVLTAYGALKQVVSELDRFSRDERRRAYYGKAAQLATKINSAQKAVKQDWYSLSDGQRLLLLDLLLGYYCRSRRGEDINASVSWTSIWAEVHQSAEFLAARDHSLETVATFLHLLNLLYSAPVDDSEFFAFAASRTALMVRRRALTVVQEAGGTAADDAVRFRQEELDELLAEHKAEFQQINRVRRAQLERFEAAQRLLHEPASVPAAAAHAQRSSLAFFFERLHPADQAAVVEAAREFLYTACIERAVHGRALDPLPLIGRIFDAFHSFELDSAWRCELVSHDLDLIVHFYRAHDAHPDVVDGLANLLAAKKPAWAARLFPRLSVTMQEQAVSHCRKLLLDSHAQWEHQKMLPDAARMYADSLDMSLQQRGGMSAFHVNSLDRVDPHASTADDDPLLKQLTDLYQWILPWAPGVGPARTNMKNAPEYFERNWGRLSEPQRKLVIIELVRGYCLLRAVGTDVFDWKTFTKLSSSTSVHARISYLPAEPTSDDLLRTSRTSLKAFDSVFADLINLYSAPEHPDEGFSAQLNAARARVEDLNARLARRDETGAAFVGTRLPAARQEVKDIKARRRARVAELTAERKQFKMQLESARAAFGRTAEARRWTTLGPSRQARILEHGQQLVFETCTRFAQDDALADPVPLIKKLLQPLVPFSTYNTCLVDVASFIRLYQPRLSSQARFDLDNKLLDLHCAPAVERWYELSDGARAQAIMRCKATLVYPTMYLNEHGHLPPVDDVVQRFLSALAPPSQTPAHLLSGPPQASSWSSEAPYFPERRT